MAATKISALTALGAAPANGDLFPIVDISDLTMAASGTDKKVTWLELKSGLFAGTNNRAVKYTSGTSIGDGSWEYVGNDHLPIVSGSNIGDADQRVGTIFMASTVDYSGDMSFISSAIQKVKLGTNGNMTIGLGAASYRLAVEENQNVTANIPTLLLRNYGDGVNMFTETRISFYNSSGSNPDTFMGSVFSKFDGTNAGDGRLSFDTELSASPFRAIALSLKDGKVGIGRAGAALTPAASLDIVGLGATSATYSLKVSNSTPSGIFYVRNDGNSSFGTSPITNSKLYILASSSNIITGQFDNTNTAGGTQYALAAQSLGAGNASNIGVYIEATSATDNYAIYANSGNLYINTGRVGINASINSGYRVNISSSASDTQGIRCLMIGTGGGTNYSGIFTATGTSAGTNVGLYTLASGGATNIAAHLDGNVLIGGTVETIQPSGNGAGVWKLGKLVNAASVLDASNYIEVMIDGTIRKLCIST